MTLLTIKEAAAACRISVGFLQAALRAGELPCVRLGKVRGKRIRPEDLEAWVKSRIEYADAAYQREMKELTRVAAGLKVPQ